MHDGIMFAFGMLAGVGLVIAVLIGAMVFAE
jgi:hypothetical protein